MIRWLRHLFAASTGQALTDTDKKVAEYTGRAVGELRRMRAYETVRDLEANWAITLRGYKGLAHEEMMRLRARAELLPWQRQDIVTI